MRTEELFKCSHCGEFKPKSEFSKNNYSYKELESGKRKKGRIGFTYDCLKCLQIKHKKYFSENPHIKEKLYTKRRAYYKTKEYSIKARTRDYLRRYGITIDDYEKILKEQDGKCAICGVSAEKNKNGRLFVDHDHKDGKVRGLLCVKCNTTLAVIEVDGWVEKAQSYLNKHLQEK